MVLEVKLGANTFRVEIPETPKKNGPWYADAYEKTNSGWKLITDLDADERHKDAAIRWAAVSGEKSYSTDSHRKTRS